MHDELIKSQTLSTGSSDACSGGFSESHGSDVDFGHLEETDVVGDSSDNDGGSLAIIRRHSYD